MISKDRSGTHMRCRLSRTIRVRALLVVASAMLLFFSGGGFLGCASGGVGHRDPLIVGVSATAPPILFEENGEIKGVEADLAQLVAERLGRPIEFKRYAFVDLFSALERGEVDVLMSGLSITPERSAFVRFTEPYMEVGQLAVIRQEDVGRFGLPNAMRRAGVRVGYERGSTAEMYVAARLPRAEAFAFDDVDAGVRSLRAKRIDYFIHDAPTIWRLAGDPKSRDLLGLYRPLTQEFLAWAVRPEDTHLLSLLNTALSHWKREGVIETILARWIPVRILRR